MKKEPKRFNMNMVPKNCPTALGFLKGIYANGGFQKASNQINKNQYGWYKTAFLLLFKVAKDVPKGMA